jgi:hypothetical protein
MTEAGHLEWFFEEKEVTMWATSMLLVGILRKVEKIDRLVSTLLKMPIRQGQVEWNCVGCWVKEALEPLDADGKALGTSVTEWQAVRDGVM